MRKTEHMVVPFELKGLDEETGTFEGYASVFGNVDLGNDIVEPGAFKRTLDHTKGEVPILWFHDPSQPVGIGVSAVEDAKGLLVKGQIDLDTQKGREVYSGMKMGYIQAMSIGYKAIGKEIKDGIRHLTELALPEYSLLTKGFAMNPEAAVESVKAVTDFNGALAEAVAEAELYDRRWKITDALWKVQHDLEDDDTLAPEEKVAAFKTSLAQFADAMAGWFADYLAVEATDDNTEAIGMMSAAFDLEAKVGAVLSAANLAKVQAAVDALNALLEEAAPKQAPDDGSLEAPVAGSLDPEAVKLELAAFEARFATLSL